MKIKWNKEIDILYINFNMPPKSVKKNKMSDATLQTVNNSFSSTNESWRNLSSDPPVNIPSSDPPVNTPSSDPPINTPSSDQPVNTPSSDSPVNTPSSLSTTEQHVDTSQSLSTTEQTKIVEQPVVKSSVLEYDQDLYRHLDKTSLNQYSIDDLLRVLSVRGYDNKNPALWAGARRLMQQLSCEQIEKEKKPNKKPPPYIRDAPFREQRHEAKKEQRQEIKEQRHEAKERRENSYRGKKYEHNSDSQSNIEVLNTESKPFNKSYTRQYSNAESRQYRDKSKYNRNIDSA